jgi:hypothetical protein
MNTPKDDFEKAERFQRLFVTPLVDAVRVEMKAHLEPMNQTLTRIEAFEPRISKLERSQKKALAGLGIFATLIGLGCRAGWEWASDHLFHK